MHGLQTYLKTLYSTFSDEQTVTKLLFFAVSHSFRLAIEGNSLKFLSYFQLFELPSSSTL